MSFDDDEIEDEGYFAEVDEGDPTGLEPRFVGMDVLSVAPAMFNDYKVNDLFSAYIALRNQLTTDRKGWKLREARMKAQMLVIGSVLLNKSTALGVNSLSADSGSGYTSKKERFKVAPDGWEAFTEWLHATKNYHCIQKRVSPDAVREVCTETGSLPPGLETHTEMTFVVRSPSTRKR
jgi:hypothetical protein